jgi:hypothetical protein
MFLLLRSKLLKQWNQKDSQPQPSGGRIVPAVAAEKRDRGSGTPNTDNLKTSDTRQNGEVYCILHSVAVRHARYGRVP